MTPFSSIKVLQFQRFIFITLTFQNNARKLIVKIFFKNKLTAALLGA